MFRSGYYATKQGIKADGIGVMTLLVLLSVILLYLSNNY